jgi:hypothetical protein
MALTRHAQVPLIAPRGRAGLRTVSPVVPSAGFRGFLVLSLGAVGDGDLGVLFECRAVLCVERGWHV